MTGPQIGAPALYRREEVEHMQRSHDATVRRLEQTIREQMATIARLTAKGGA